MEIIRTILSQIAAFFGIYNARLYGATGNGTTDDRAAIQAALDAAKARGGGIVFLPPGTYLIRRSLFIGSKVTLQGAGRGVTTITKPASVKSLLTANASALATSVTVANGALFAVGDAIHLYDTTSFEWLSTQGHITGIATNVLTFTNDEGLGRTGLDGALQTARAATATTSFPLIRNDLGSLRQGVCDLTLDQAQNANDPAPTSSSVQAQTDFTLATIHWVESYYALVENVEFANASGDAYSDQAQDGTGITPAASLNKTTKNTIQWCKLRNATRHAVHLGTCMNGAFVQNNEMTSCAWYALFYCAFATNSIASGNLVEGCGSGFAGIDDRDSGNVISGNTVKNWLVWAIDAAAGATGATGAALGQNVVTNNILIDTGGASGVITWNLKEGVISNNYIDMGTINGEAIRLGVNADRSSCTGNVIISSGTTTSIAFYLDQCDDVRIVGNICRGMTKGASVRGVQRLVAIGNHMSSMVNAIGWDFQVSTSTDCVIKDERNVLTNPWTTSSSGVVVRLVYEGVGDNAANDPAAAGDWFAASGKMFNGQLVRWNSGGGEKISIFNNGVGWTVLN